MIFSPRFCQCLQGLVILAMAMSLSACGTAKLKREANQIVQRTRVPENGAKVQELQQICQELARQNLRYTFGSCHPANGGLDCSGTIHHVFSRLGYRSMPRQSNHQYYWVKEYGKMRHASSLSPKVLRRLRPGDLLFWKGTYRTGKRWPNISHVMIYSGKDPATGKHHMFGGRSGKRHGYNGSQIDFFELRTGESEGRSGKFVGYGTPPGLRR